MNSNSIPLQKNTSIMNCIDLLTFSKNLNIKIPQNPSAIIQLARQLQQKSHRIDQAGSLHHNIVSSYINYSLKFPSSESMAPHH
jgi:hypothetical protein